MQLGARGHGLHHSALGEVWVGGKRQWFGKGFWSLCVCFVEWVWNGFGSFFFFFFFCSLIPVVDWPSFFSFYIYILRVWDELFAFGFSWRRRQTGAFFFGEL